MSEGSGEGNSSKEESDKDPGRQSESLLRKQHSRQRSQMLRGLSTHSTRSGGSKKETPTFGWDTVKKSVKRCVASRGSLASYPQATHAAHCTVLNILIIL